MKRPLLLDLFCGAGGCAMGYHRAGFDVVGVDHKPQPRYPFRFVQGDAMNPPFDLREFDAIHASPPCQAYSIATRHLANPSDKLIDSTRSMLESSGKPWVIENVPGAPISMESTLFGDHGVLLCGTNFGMRILRHRLFATSFPIVRPGNCNHPDEPINPHRESSRKRMRKEFGQVDLERIWRKEAGVEWMDKHGGRQAIPPAYTEYIGKQLMRVLQ